MLRYLEIKNQLLALTDKMQPGEKLMDRCSLCKILDTTRTTLDKAIRELVDQGILVSQKGSGTYIASSLINPVKGTINWCVMVPNFESIYAKLVSGIENVAQKYNINVILCCSNSDLSRQEQYIHRLLTSGADGFIIVPVITSTPQESIPLYNQLVSSTIPFVFCNRSIEGISVPVITSNDFYGGYIATKHLLERGYRKVAYVAHRKYKTSVDRCQGYLSALQEKDIEIDRKIIYMPNSTDAVDCKSAVVSMLKQNKIDSVFCFNDSVAIKVIEALQEEGKRVSHDIGVIGYDNTEVANGASLSSVSYRTNEIGQKAAEVLYSMLIGEKPSSGFDYYLFKPEIIDRSSCLGKSK